SVSASLLNLGSGGVRMAVTSGASGSRGRIALDSSSLAIAFNQTLAAQDALLSVGGSSSGGGVLISSSTDSFDGVLPGVKLTLTEASQKVVTVDVTKNNDGLSKQLSTIIDQYNKMHDKLSELTSFDPVKFTTGSLFGSSEALRIDLAFGQLFSGTHSGAGSIRSISELGVSFDENGKLSLDKDRLQSALDRDPDAVKKFLSDKDKGFSTIAKKVADSLAGTEHGALIKKSETLQSKIDLNSDRIESFNKRLDNQRERMLKQFYDMEAAIAKIQSNMSSIQKIQPITMPSGN
ncbi:MAG: flagellar filament capping protein FliD, partial [Aureliella sp.]